jgi:hypothetical protein
MNDLIELVTLLNRSRLHTGLPLWSACATTVAEPARTHRLFIKALSAQDHE